MANLRAANYGQNDLGYFGAAAQLSDQTQLSAKDLLALFAGGEWIGRRTTLQKRRCKRKKESQGGREKATDGSEKVESSTGRQKERERERERESPNFRLRRNPRFVKSALSGNGWGRRARKRAIFLATTFCYIFAQVLSTNHPVGRSNRSRMKKGLTSRWANKLEWMKLRVRARESTCAGAQFNSSVEISTDFTTVG